MTFEPLSSDFYGFENALTDQEKDSIMRLRAFLEAEVRPIVNDLWAKAEFFPRSVVEGLADLGLFGLPWEETQHVRELARSSAAGSRSSSPASTRASPPSSACRTASSWARSPSPAPTEQRAEWLPKFAAGEVLGAFGLTEPLSGSDTAQGLRTVAKRDGDNWVINGAKRWIGNGSISDVTIVWAKRRRRRPGQGLHRPDLDPRLLGQAASRTSRRCASCRTPTSPSPTWSCPRPTACRTRNSFRETAAVLRLTRAEVAWAAVGNSIGAYEAAVKYAGERIQFGKTIDEHQLIQELLAKSARQHHRVDRPRAPASREMLDEGIQKDEHSALAKEFTTSRMRETVAWCRELLGGNGIVLDYDVMRHFADAEALYSYEGTREMNTLIVGRAITGKAAFV